jgi:hypothetical protein
MSKQLGKIIIDAGVKNVWPWEMHSAQALCNAGYVVTFVPKHGSARSADAYLDNTLYEFKSPEGSTIDNVINNLLKALRYQSKNIVIDSSRMKKIQDRSIVNYLKRYTRNKRGIRNLIFVSRNGTVVDIVHARK